MQSALLELRFLPCDGFPSTEDSEQSLGIFWVVNLEMQINTMNGLNILQCMGQQAVSQQLSPHASSTVVEKR